MEGMTRVMIGWDSFSICMIIISVVIFSSMRPRQIRVLAKQEDAGRIVVFLIVLAATLGSLLGVLLLLQNKEPWLLGKGVETAIYLTGVISSWVLLHTMFAYRYALLYYGEHPLDPDIHTVGLQIPNELWPDYLDFAYFSFVIGMTFQVSDIEISSRLIRISIADVVVLTMGTSAVTKRLSLKPPTGSSMSMMGSAPSSRINPSRTTVLNPCRSAVSE